MIAITARLCGSALAAGTGATCARKLLDLPRPPSAIFVANHEATLGVLRVTAERNIAIPDDLSLLCYEDMPWFEWHRPAISIVDSTWPSTG